MSMTINVRSIRNPQGPASIDGATQCIMPLVGDVASKLEVGHPTIFEKAFSRISVGRVDLYDLSSEDLKVVYDMTRAKFEEFLSIYPTEEDRKSVSGTWECWTEYIEALESDARLM